MKKPSRLTTGLALSSSLFAAVVAFSTVGPQRIPDSASQSTQPRARAAAAAAPRLVVPTAVTRLVRESAAAPRAATRSSVG